MSGMSWYQVLAVASLLVGVSCPAQQSGGASAASPPVAVWKAAFQGGRPVLEVSLNGQPVRPFVLDTGAAHSVLDADWAGQLGLPVTGTVEIRSPLGAGAVPVDVASVASVSIGDRMFADRSMALLDLAGMAPGMPLGVLGYRFFEGYVVELDARHQQVRLLEGGLPAPNGRDVFAFDGDVPSVPVEVAGRVFDLHLDSGSPSAITLPLAAAVQLPLQSPPTVIGRGRTVDAEFEIHGAVLDGKMSLGSLSVTNPPLAFVEGAPVGHVGSAILGKLAIAIDAAQRRVRLTRSDDETR